MAVGTAHIAFRDLREDACPRLVHGEDYDVVCFGLRVTMIKIEHGALRALAGVYPMAAFKFLIAVGRRLVTRLRHGNQKYIDSLLAAASTHAE